MDRFARGPFHVGYKRRVDLDALRQKRIAKADHQFCTDITALLDGKLAVRYSALRIGVACVVALGSGFTVAD